MKLSSIGDVVHALPVATALRRHHPQARISWAVEEWVAPLLQGHPAIDRLIVFPAMRWAGVTPAWARAFARALRALRGESYDVSLDLQGLFKSAAVAALSGAAVRLGVDGQREGAWLVSRSVPAAPGRRHVVEQYLECAGALGAAVAPVTFDLPVQPEAAQWVERKLAAQAIAPARPLLVINPSSSARWKTWPVQRWAGAAAALTADGSVVLVGGRQQTPRHAELARIAGSEILDLTGQTTLPQLVALLARCSVHLAPDTGSAHIAAALGRPVVGLYGPTPVWRQAPYGQEPLLAHSGGSCGTSCPRLCLHGRRCLQAVTPDEMVARVRILLAADSNDRLGGRS
ncbi:MAG: glycosyltransferase family 9 protein [Deltaproteobacteria bacterium]|nr:glycosyltransferase family 9 protein [Deltaproteobacteria bacterium]